MEIPIPWMGAMKKGPFPLHASLKEAEARKVLITNACTSLPTFDRPRTGAFSRLLAARQTEAPRTSRTTGRTTQTTVAAS